MAELTQQTSKRDRIFGTKAGPKSGKSESVEYSAGTSPLCPQCGSKKLWRDGLRYSMFGDRVQRWLCRNCGFRFSDPVDVQKAWSTFERVERVDAKPRKATDDIVTTRQICVMGTKNLAAEQKPMEVPRRSDIDIKGKIVEHAFWLQKEGYAEATITRRIRLLKTLANKGANLLDPESLKETIAKQQKWSTKTRDRRRNLRLLPENARQNLGSAPLQSMQKTAFHTQ